MKIMRVFLLSLVFWPICAQAEETESAASVKADAVFMRFDKDGDGFVSLEELMAQVKNDPVKWERWFRSRDVDKDDKLSPEEFNAKRGEAKTEGEE